MKTLNQIEPRVIISGLPYTITNRGSYYLTQSLAGTGSNGIIISASDVTLDLNGFSLTAGSTNFGCSGIVLDLATNLYMNLTIRNGIVSGWPNAGLVLIDGINCRLSGISAVGNGAQGGTGIYIGKDWEVENCVAFRNFGPGIVVGDYSHARNCRARQNGGIGFSSGIGSVLQNCISAENGSYGFFGQTLSVIQDCVSLNNTNDGIYVGPNSIALRNLSGQNVGSGFSAGSGSKLEGNVSSFNQGDGIWAGSESTVARNQLSGNAGAGVRGGQNCRVEENHAVANSYGFQAMENNPGSLFVENSAGGNGTNFAQAIGAHFARAAGTNLLGTNFSLVNPWANFELDR